VRPIELTGIAGAVIIVAVILASLATWAWVITAVFSAPRRLAPRWALGALATATVLNAVAGRSRTEPWARWPLTAVTILTVLAAVILLVDRRRRRRPKP